MGELESLCRGCATLLVIIIAIVLVGVGILLASIQSKKYNDSSAVVILGEENDDADRHW